MYASDENIISMEGGHIHSGDVIIEMCSNTKSIHKKNSYDKKSENLNINSTTAAVIIK